jgi:hypothetical protein
MLHMRMMKVSIPRLEEAFGAEWRQTFPAAVARGSREVSIEVTDEQRAKIKHRPNAAPKTPIVIHVKPVPRDQWKWKIRMLAMARQDGDRGVGDVLERIIKIGGGEQFLKLFPELGNAMGQQATDWLMGVKTPVQANVEDREKCSPCSVRRDILNARYPFNGH